jgi:hypothetical protein
MAAIGKAVVQKHSIKGWSRPRADIPFDVAQISIETDPIDPFRGISPLFLSSWISSEYLSSP